MFDVSKQPRSKSIYFWNAAGSFSNSLSSIVLLFTVTRFLGPVEAGIFSIAMAIAQQMWSVVNYDMTVYQATDVNNRFLFSQYMGIRVVLIVIAMIIGTAIAVMNSYSPYKLSVVIALCLYKCLDAAANAFVGLFQKNNRLDISGKSIFYKTTLATAVFVMVMLITKNILIASIIMAAIYFLWMVFYDFGFAINYEKISFNFDSKKMIAILIDCFPMFAASFMIIFLSNLPKYAIDSLFSEEIQTYFNILIMPAFIINLLSLFIFRPAIITMSSYWNSHNHHAFIKKMLNLYLSILVITGICIAGAYVCGIPVLSWFYGVDLASYRTPFCIIILAGGMGAISTLAYNILTIFRKQNYILFAYIIPCVFALLATKPFVAATEIMGASVSYLITMTLLSVNLFAAVIMAIKKRRG